MQNGVLFSSIRPLDQNSLGIEFCIIKKKIFVFLLCKRYLANSDFQKLLLCTCTVYLILCVCADILFID